MKIKQRYIRYSEDLPCCIFLPHLRNTYFSKYRCYIPPIYTMDSPFFSVIKEAIKMCGLDISTYALPPASPLSDEKKEELREILKQSKLI